jgi:hypothetical protein
VRGVRRCLPAGCILGLGEKTDTDSTLSRRVLALQCVCAGLPGRRSDQIENPVPNVYMLQIVFVADMVRSIVKSLD